MDLAPDFDEFIGSLIAERAEFLVVDAYALAFHGAPRFTGDIDFFVRPTIENAERVLAAVRAFGFPASELDAKAMIDPRRILQMGVEPVQIHVMSAISGVTWDEAWLSRAPGRCGSHEVAFLGREAFLENKRASAPAERSRRPRRTGTGELGVTPSYREAWPFGSVPSGRAAFTL